MLDIAYRERSWELAFIREETWLDILHSDERFLELLKKIR
jgi:hypothetical protein